MIPRVIHRVWLGSEPMPDEFEHYGETWREHHPDWELRLWTDSNLPELRYPDALERCRNHGERSDILRSELLLRFGGLYVDTDVECRRSIEPLIQDTTAFAAWVRPGRIGSAVLGAEPGHPAIERMLTEMKDTVGQGDQVEVTVGVLTRVLSDSPDVTVFDSDTFYPYHPLHNPAGEDADFPDAYAIHHWGLTWKTRDDLRDRLRGIRDKLDTVREENRRLERRRRRLGKKVRRAEARNDALVAAVHRKRRRVRAVEGSRWWRGRRRILTGLAPARPLLRRARARSHR